MFENSNVERDGGGLVMTLQDSGDIIVTLEAPDESYHPKREDAERWFDQGRSDWSIFIDLTDDWVANGDIDHLWDEDKEHYGMLTGCELIFTDGMDWLDCGHRIVYGRVWWHERYAIENAIEEMLSEKGLLLKLGAEMEPRESYGYSEDNSVVCPWCGRVTK